MKQVNLKIFILSALIVGFVSSCDLNEKAYRRLLKAGRWHVTNLQSDNTSFTKLPKWQIYDCEDHSNPCLGKWEHQNGSVCNFYYSFTNLGGEFNFYPNPNESDMTTMAYSQCTNFSGNYKVKKLSKKYFDLESDNTSGYPGKTVTINLIRE